MDLLTTGVDVPSVRNIVFFRYVSSPISFYQMVGRGTRIDPVTGKLMFRVYDYTNATRLFGQGFVTAPATASAPEEGGDGPREHTIQVAGVTVHVTDAGRYILTTVDGRTVPVTVEEYAERLAARLVAEAPTLDAFRGLWVTKDARQGLLGQLPEAGRSAEVIRALRGMDDFDLYDVLAELGYGLDPRTRLQRAEGFSYKNEPWLNGMPGRAAATVRAIAAQFARGGTEGLENRYIFQTPEVERAGGVAALKEAGVPVEVLRETRERIFAT